MTSASPIVLLSEFMTAPAMAIVAVFTAISGISSASATQLNGAPPSFVSMMRQTKVEIDQAGNVWSLNNWKPNVPIDIAVNLAVMASSFSSASPPRATPTP